MKYAKENALKGRTFEQSRRTERVLAQLGDTSVADTRIHGTTKKQVGKLFEEVERQALLPLPPGSLPHVPGSSPNSESRWPRRSGESLLFGSARVRQLAPIVGALGHASRSHLQRSVAATLRACEVRTRSVPHVSNDHIPKEKFSVVERGTKAMLERIDLIGPSTPVAGRRR